jgi:hypothetical protein
MTTIVTINHPEAAHLEAVKADMIKLGAPVIRAIRDEAQGIIVALEGSHRLAAAHELGISPVLRILGEDDMITCEDLGYDDMGWFDGEPARAADIRDRIGHPQGTYAGCNFLKFDAVEEVK